jgi:YggT family protein
MDRALIFLLETFLGLFALALLLRFYLQAVRAPAHNPLAGFIAALTNFAVRPARRFIPGLWGYDLSSLVLAWVVEIVLIGVVLSLKGYDFGGSVGAGLAGIVLLAATRLFRLFIYVVIFATIVQAVLSWVNPYSPAMPILSPMTRPWLRLFQRWVPPIGGIDLSPLFVLVVCQLILMWPLPNLEALFAQMIVGRPAMP